MTDPVFVGLVAGSFVGVLVVIAEGPHRITAFALPLMIACAALAVPYEEHGADPIGEARTALSAGSAFVHQAPEALLPFIGSAVAAGFLMYLVKERSRV